MLSDVCKFGCMLSGSSFLLLLTVLRRARAGGTLEESVRTSALSASLHPVGACLLVGTWRAKHGLGADVPESRLFPHLWPKCVNTCVAILFRCGFGWKHVNKHVGVTACLFTTLRVFLFSC